MGEDRKKEDYVARIAAASPAKLVVITYEIILDYMEEARNLAGDKAAAGVERALEGVRQLMGGLNFEYEISQDLMDCYLRVNKLLNAVRFGGQAGKGAEAPASELTEAAAIIRSLMESFIEIDKDGESGPPAMENAPHIYAGLTYKNGELSEFVDDTGRGFKA